MARQTAYNSVPDLYRSLRQLTRLASQELRGASVAIASGIAGDARDEAMHVGGVARLVAPTLKATSDRVPVVRMGGNTKLPARNGRRRQGDRQTVGDVWAGAEFGGRGRPTTQQFRPHQGRRGYFLWPTVRAHSDQTQREYSAALAKALQRIPA